MNVSKEATEAALAVYNAARDKAHGQQACMNGALRAALPFLARPAPSQSDEERAREIAEHAGIDMMDDHDLFIAEMSMALAEATLAGAAAEREAGAILADEEADRCETAANQPGMEKLPAMQDAIMGCARRARAIAAAIRARKP